MATVGEREMKLYRVTHYYEGGISQEFEWTTSKDKAKKLLSIYHEEVTKYERGIDSKIDKFEFSLTKAGILRLLRLVASHADNR